jgi:two-component system, OmpR family, alkaline phosphatase synthesis response regulator PhoP
VLVVDDDPEIRNALRFLLEHDGYSVHEAVNGHQAIDVLRTNPRRMVVLLDMRMPGMTGQEVLEQVADQLVLARHAYILLTAQFGQTMSLDAAELVAQLAIPVITKPIDLNKLLSAVDAAAARLP